MTTETRVRSEYRSSLRSKALIRRALLELLDEKPYAKITITDIVERAEINRGTFYLHYQNISDAVEKICLVFIGELLSSLKTISAEDVLDDPQIVFSSVSEFLIKSNMEMSRILSLPPAALALSEAKSIALEKLGEIMDASGRYDIDRADVILSYIIAGIIDVYMGILSGELDMTLDEAPEYLAKCTKRLFLNQYRLETAVAE